MVLIKNVVQQAFTDQEKKNTKFTTVLLVKASLEYLQYF